MQHKLELFNLINTNHFLYLQLHLGNNTRLINLYINKFLTGNLKNNAVFNISKIFFLIQKIFYFYTTIQQNNPFILNIAKKKNIQKLIPITYSTVKKHIQLLQEVSIFYKSSYFFNNNTLSTLTNLKQNYDYIIKQKNFSEEQKILLRNIHDAQNFNFFILQKTEKKIKDNEQLSRNTKNTLLKILNMKNHIFLTLLDSNKSPVSIPYILLGNENTTIGVYFYINFFLKLATNNI